MSRASVVFLSLFLYTPVCNKDLFKYFTQPYNAFYYHLKQIEVRNRLLSTPLPLRQTPASISNILISKETRGMRGKGGGASFQIFSSNSETQSRNRRFKTFYKWTREREEY